MRLDTIKVLNLHLINAAESQRELVPDVPVQSKRFFEPPPHPDQSLSFFLRSLILFEVMVLGRVRY